MGSDPGSLDSVPGIWFSAVSNARDSGCGIRHNQNLFIPFYTTKAQGSGIGLALSRQIIELHQGSLQIFNRESTKGCCARIELPLIQHQE